MSYRDFRLVDVVNQFHLQVNESIGLFEQTEPVTPSAHLLETLRFNLPLASTLGTEKARSELLIAPVLVEIKRVHRPDVSFFSGIELTVDPAVGLAGVCDFLLSLSPEQMYLRAPVITLVEAKSESLREGMGQCVAEMIAADRFNEAEGNVIPVVHGAVTTGTAWKFLRKRGAVIEIDLNEYALAQPERILGILLSMLPKTT